MSFLKNIFGNSDENKSEVKSNLNWFPLTEVNQLDEIIEQSKEKTVLIFKHSTRCIISRTVLKNFEKDYNFGEEVIPYYLDLLEFRPISNEIASVFGVAHQSPQILVIKNGVSVYDNSHDGILIEDIIKYI